MLRLSSTILALALFAAWPARAEEETVRVVFAGDIMLDGGPGHIVTTGGDPFSSVSAALSDADLTVGNLECAIVKKGYPEEKSYAFRGPEAAVPLLKRHFSAISLANNHSGDWGRKGFATGLELLREHQLPYFGGGMNAQEAHQPLVLAAAGRRVAFLGYNDFPPRSFAAGPSTPGITWLVDKDIVRDLKRARAEADVVLLYLHWGRELRPAAEPEQKRLARLFIDAGADAVIGSHPHVTQEVEWYKDRPIVYSLGNFVFDYYPYDPPVWRGWMARLTFAKETRPALELIPVELDQDGTPHLSPAVSASEPRGSDATATQQPPGR